MYAVCWPESGPHARNVYYSIKKLIWFFTKLHCFIKENWNITCSVFAGKLNTMCSPGRCVQFTMWTSFREKMNHTYLCSNLTGIKEVKNCLPCNLVYLICKFKIKGVLQLAFNVGMEIECAPWFNSKCIPPSAQSRGSLWMVWGCQRSSNLHCCWWKGEMDMWAG